MDFPEIEGSLAVNNFNLFLEGKGIDFRLSKCEIFYSESSIKFKDDVRGFWSIPFISGLTGYDLKGIAFMTDHPQTVQGPGAIISPPNFKS